MLSSRSVEKLHPMEPASTPTDAQAVARGERFELGRNWTRFLAGWTTGRIDGACKSLRRMLGVQTLASATFLDVGSGSGLFSLAAMRLGAARVVSFDHDPHSVACGRELSATISRRRTNWSIEQGDVLDDRYLERLGSFDVVYSFGVLAPDGQAVGRARQRGLPGRAQRLAVHRRPSRPGLEVGGVAEGQQLYNSGVIGRMVVLFGPSCRSSG